MPISDRQKASNIRYNRSMDSIMLRPSKERGAKIRAAAMAAGKPLQVYILEAVEERIRQEAGDGQTEAAPPAGE